MAGSIAWARRTQKPAATPIPPPTAVETPAVRRRQAGPGASRARRSAAPAGRDQQFLVRLFNEPGPIPAAKPQPTFTLKGPGTIDKAGLFQTPADNKPAATIVTAKVGDVDGHARIRVVPPLPWKFDFQKATLVENPKTKLKAGQAADHLDRHRYRHIIREVDGRKVMVKVDHDPQGNAQPRLDGPDDCTTTRSRPTSAAPTIRRTTLQTHARHRPDRSALHAGDDGGRPAIADSLLAAADRHAVFLTKVVSLEAERLVHDEVPSSYRRRQGGAEGQGLAARRQGARRLDDRGHRRRCRTSQGSPGLFGERATRVVVYYDNIQVHPNADAASKS